MNDDLIYKMVDRFLQWKLPEDFSPDAGISFKRNFNEHLTPPMRHEPTGTNLLNAKQAEDMVRYITEAQTAEITRLRKQLAEAERQRDAARAEALEEAAMAVRMGRWKNRDWVPGSLWDKLRAEMERDIRALIKEDRT